MRQIGALELDMAALGEEEIATGDDSGMKQTVGEDGVPRNSVNADQGSAGMRK